MKTPAAVRLLSAAAALVTSLSLLSAVAALGEPAVSPQVLAQDAAAPLR